MNGKAIEGKTETLTLERIGDGRRRENESTEETEGEAWRVNKKNEKQKQNVMQWRIQK